MRRSLILAVAMVCLPLFAAEIAPRRAQLTAERVDGRIVLTIDARGSSVVDLLDRIAAHLDRPLSRQLRADRIVDFKRDRIAPDEALREIARAERLVLTGTRRGWTISDPAEPTLTMNVKDADIHSLMQIVKEQCGIRNLIIDPGVSGSGTFLFNDVSCTQGIETILRSIGLGYEIESSVLRVSSSSS